MRRHGDSQQCGQGYGGEQGKGEFHDGLLDGRSAMIAPPAMESLHLGRVLAPAALVTARRYQGLMAVPCGFAHAVTRM